MGSRIGEMIQDKSNPEKYLHLIWIHAGYNAKNNVLGQYVLGTGEGWESWGAGQLKLAVLPQENA